jgi:hypothetical protein
MAARGQGDKGKKTRKTVAEARAAALPTRMESPGLLEARRRIEVAARGKAEELDLGGLGLTEIPEELYALAHLKVLYLGAPKYLQKIPYWKRTQEDQKKRNALRALPPALFTSLPHLTHLHLDQNGLVALPMEIAALTGLTSLGLSNNHIGADGARALAARPTAGLSQWALYQWGFAATCPHRHGRYVQAVLGRRISDRASRLPERRTTVALASA